MERLSSVALPASRPTPVEQVHLTLLFVGEVAKSRLEDVLESVKRAASGFRVPPLHAERLISLPARGPARLIALEMSAPPELLELQRRLALRLTRRPARKSDREFRPHLTLTRFAGGGDASVRVDLPCPLPGSFPVETVAVVSSHLHPDGATHTRLAEYSLAPGN